MASPIERMISGSVKCTICGAGFGECDCWRKCATCGWSFQKGKQCRKCHGDGQLEIVASTPDRKRRSR